MRYCGFSEGFHDAAIAFVDDQGNIEFAAQSERYSKIKNDPNLHLYLKKMISEDDHVAYYENETLRKQHDAVINFHGGIRSPSVRYDSFFNHHVSHAAASFYTRPWESVHDVVMLTIDGVGEYQSATIMDHNFNILHEEIFPKSIGFVYATVTKLLGFKPLEEEYIVMGLAAYGEPKYYDDICQIYDTYETAEHITKYLSVFTKFDPFEPADLAASVQKWAEAKIVELASIARKYGSKLVYSGGVAQNIKANSLVHQLFDDMWIMPAPGDSGSALGAAARAYALHTGKDRVNWIDSYLGAYPDGAIERHPINVNHIVDYLVKEKGYCGVVDGRAEFGPRALGNRSLLANPSIDLKTTINKVKHRQKFRPFGPMILEEYADQYFEGVYNEYMQYSCNSLHDFSSVKHVDNSARVQIVKPTSRSIARIVLEEFYNKTKIPMLLNTSLNVRGKPMCNDVYDAYLVKHKYGIKVFS